MPTPRDAAADPASPRSGTGAPAGGNDHAGGVCGAGRWQPAPALGPLLAYAVGQTGNVFADASMYDLYAGYDGMDLWDWSDAAFIAQEQQTAMEIALAYTRLVACG